MNTSNIENKLKASEQLRENAITSTWLITNFVSTHTQNDFEDNKTTKVLEMLSEIRKIIPELQTME